MKFIVVVGFMVFDIITGLLYSISKKKWKSSIMREGLFHKLGFILAIVFALLCDYGQSYINLPFSIPVTNGVILYIAIVEIGSVKENLQKLSPQLKGLPINVKEK